MKSRQKEQQHLSTLNEADGKLTGMVLSSFQPQATRTFVASFRREDLDHFTVGNHVVVYIASVRASAKVISAAQAPDGSLKTGSKASRGESPHHLAHSFTMDDDDDEAETSAEVFPTEAKLATLLVTFVFDTAKEFVVVGDPVLVMPGGGPVLYGGQERGEKGVAGLEGFVGQVTDI